MILALTMIIASAHASQIVTIQNRQFEFTGDFTSKQIESIKADLETLARLEIKQGPIFTVIFGSEHKNYFEWFAARIHRFGLWTTSDKEKAVNRQGCENYHTMSAFADADYDKNGELFQKGDYMVTPYYFDDKTSGRLSTLVHEARHADGLKHVKCLRRLNYKLDRCLARAKGACDKDEFGSYTADGLVQMQATRLLKDMYFDQAAGVAVAAFNRIQSTDARRRAGKEIQKLMPELNIRDTDLYDWMDTYPE